MKTKLLLMLFYSFLVLKSYAQTIHIEIVATTPFGSEIVNLTNDNTIEVPQETKELKLITIKCRDLPMSHKLMVTVAGETIEYNTPNEEKQLSFLNNILAKEINIRHFDNTGTEITNDAIKLRFIPGNESHGNETVGAINIPLQASIDEYLQNNYSNLESTPFGYVDPTDKERRIHIFFDYFGNSLLSTIPSGISNAQYVVHIIYPFSNADPNRISYSVRQKSGTFNNALLFNNSNSHSQIPGQLQSGEKYDGITEREFLLGTSTDDLTFDIIAATKDDQVTKKTLESYTIKMSPVYHGSFDVGFVKTNLSNPTYNLVNLPNSTDQVVKVTDRSPKGIVTIMASFYVSPVILLESVFGKKRIPFYKLTGRSFLDDHRFYERFYPTIGVGVSDKSFENIFYGVNWEIARGLAIFGGWHYGKVRTFEMPNFEAGVTPVTNDQFEFYKNTKWKTSTAFGIKLDIMIVRNLFAAVGK